MRVFVWAASLVLFSGCAAQQPEVTPVPTETKVDQSFDVTTVLQNRWAVLPLLLESKKTQSYQLIPSSDIAVSFNSAGIPFLTSAWQHSGDRMTNYLVIDLLDGARSYAFEGPTAIVADVTFARRGEMHFPGVLLTHARVSDANDDKQIDQHDPRSLHMYELVTKERRQLSPPGVDVLEVDVIGEQILLTVAPAPGSALRGLYLVDSNTWRGHFVAEDLTP